MKWDYLTSILRILYALVAYALPCLASMKAVVTMDESAIKEMITYWICFTCLEYIHLSGLVRIPLLLKICALTWLTAPAFQGSYLIYSKFLHPSYEKYEEQIDEMVTDFHRRSVRTIKQTFWDILSAQNRAASLQDASIGVISTKFSNDFIQLLRQDGVFFEICANNDSNQFIPCECTLSDNLTVLHLRAVPPKENSFEMKLRNIFLTNLRSVSIDDESTRNVLLLLETRDSFGIFVQVIKCRASSPEEAFTFCTGLQMVCMSARGHVLHAMRRLTNALTRHYNLTRLKEYFNRLKLAKGTF